VDIFDFLEEIFWKISENSKMSITLTY